MFNMGLCCSGSMAGCVPVSRSSNLLRPSFIYQEVAQYGRALALDARGREFKSHLRYMYKSVQNIKYQSYIHLAQKNKIGIIGSCEIVIYWV